MGNAGGTLIGSTGAAAQMPRPPSEPDDDTFRGRVALRLKALRIAARLDVDRAAAAITAAGFEIGDRGLYKWEQARAMPHMEALPAIAKAYGVAVRNVLPKE